MGVKKELRINSHFFMVLARGISGFSSRFSRSKDCGGPLQKYRGWLFSILNKRKMTII